MTSIIVLRGEWLDLSIGNEAAGELMLSDNVGGGISRMEEIELYAYRGHPVIDFDNDFERSYYDYLKKEVELEYND